MSRRSALTIHQTVDAGSRWQRREPAQPLTANRVVSVKKITGGRRQHDFDSSIMQLQIVGGGTVLTDDIDVDGSHELGASANAGAKVGHGAGRCGGGWWQLPLMDLYIYKTWAWGQGC